MNSNAYRPSQASFHTSTREHPDAGLIHPRTMHRTPDSHLYMSRLPGSVRSRPRLIQRPSMNDLYLNRGQGLRPSLYQSTPEKSDLDMWGCCRLSNRASQSDLVPDVDPTTPVSKPQPKADTPPPDNTNRRTTQISRKRLSTAANLSDNEEDNQEDASYNLRRSTRLPKRIKISPPPKAATNPVEGEGRIRKVSKLKQQVAAGKGPKKGPLGPRGTTDRLEDGSLVWLDPDSGQWSKYTPTKHL